MTDSVVGHHAEKYWKWNYLTLLRLCHAVSGALHGFSISLIDQRWAAGAAGHVNQGHKRLGCWGVSSVRTTAECQT
jgi:hypothetical protein